MTQRLSLFPLRPDEAKVWELYELQEAASWAVSEVSLNDDVVDWETLNPDLKSILEELMAFFAVSDRLIALNLQSLQASINDNDLARSMFLASQERIEGVHQHMYSLFIATIVPNPARRLELYNAVSTYPAIAIKTKWMQDNMTVEDLRHRIVANACGEGIGFSNAFGIALLPKTMGKLYGWCYGNSKVLEDEFIHFTHCCEWYKELNDPLDDETFHSIVQGAVEVEKQFVKDILKDYKLPGLNAELLTEYCMYIADLLCNMCGHRGLYNVTTNPIDYMDLTGLKIKTNFFEILPGQYKKPTIDETQTPLELNFARRV